MKSLRRCKSTWCVTHTPCVTHCKPDIVRRCTRHHSCYRNSTEQTVTPPPPPQTMFPSSPTQQSMGVRLAEYEERYEMSSSLEGNDRLLREKRSDNLKPAPRIDDPLAVSTVYIGLYGMIGTCLNQPHGALSDAFRLTPFETTTASFVFGLASGFFSGHALVSLARSLFSISFPQVRFFRNSDVFPSIHLSRQHPSSVPSAPGG